MNQTALMTIAFTIPFLASTVGCSLVYLFKSFSKTANTLALSLSSGIMLSASIFSLLLPSIEYSTSNSNIHFILPVVIGLCLGIIIMIATNLLSSKINSRNNKVTSLFLAITIHNIPEGLIVGFSIGGAVATNSFSFAAISIAIGIAIQNLPEGLATTLPIYNYTKNKTKSFLLGTLSGVVEPIFAILGYFLSSHIISLLPWLLSFSAGTMFFVVFEELLPDSYQTNKSLLSTISLLSGFLIMMCLDLCL